MKQTSLFERTPTPIPVEPDELAVPAVKCEHNRRILILAKKSGECRDCGARLEAWRGDWRASKGGA